ncbi:Divalent metal cation transporter MntH [Pirellulimonas nuda]|uniref:Divalent metal cation transporter MntH n=1 Tax=Pirellulimonas nuda TaxID=2528009 RepID=A0A518DFN5_9BACT|nr:Nramp family divalent metal transporter [Pirellulimonas nuda]QDU90289.1 Divalent metal cation transporter MntH [Pirellulimonas nuda]
MTRSGEDAPRSRWRFGPGLLVTAAFIGPGTVATASRAGGEFGFALLWGVVFAVVATVVLQEMAARLGLVARLGLAEAIGDSLRSPWARRAALTLVVGAVVPGNTAYQTGNLIGSGVGVSLLTGLPADRVAAALGLGIAVLLACGATGRLVKHALIALVLAMSAALVATAVASRPDPSEVVRGLLWPTLPSGSLMTVLALIGTTVVPYNLFLHATAVQDRWPAVGRVADDLRSARLDTAVSITLGGVVTMAIVVTAAAAAGASGGTPSAPHELAEQLRPLLGPAGQTLFAAGLAAAGLTSAITAPLAAGYAAAGALVRSGDAIQSARVARGTAAAVAGVGAAMAYFLGKSPSQTIVAAQAANGLLLPLVAVFLLWVMNRRALLGDYCNGWRLNLAGAIVVLVAIGLGVKSLLGLVA